MCDRSFPRTRAAKMAIAVAAVLLLISEAIQAEGSLPNFVIIFVDDLGYGDLGCYGHPTIRTPRLDRMAAEGQRWTTFYSAACVCTPSRAALLTGRLPVRSGMCNDQQRVIFPEHTGGIPQDELTLAEALKSAGYATACIGKWHLGHPLKYRPTRHGFDYFFGWETSNDGAVRYKLPLRRNDEAIEFPVDQSTLTRRYTREAIQFVKQHKDGPFFLYMPHTFPHTPLHSSAPFAGQSARGLYGDVVEELDWSVGQILDTLQNESLADNTLVVFTSDNGPWLIRNQDGGSAGLLRDGKGSSWEGGFRVPGIFYWPGRIKPRVVCGPGCTMDLYVTALKLAGVVLPPDRVIDGVDLSMTLLGDVQSPRNEMFFYRGTKLYAVRWGDWKAHFITKPAYGRNIKETAHNPPLLYHLGHDPSEKYDIAGEHPEVVRQIEQIAAEHRATIQPRPSAFWDPPQSRDD